MDGSAANLEFEIDRACERPSGMAAICARLQLRQGFYRDGCCNTGREDVGSHTICVDCRAAAIAQATLACLALF